MGQGIAHGSPKQLAQLKQSIGQPRAAERRRHVTVRSLGVDDALYPSTFSLQFNVLAFGR